MKTILILTLLLTACGTWPKVAPICHHNRVYCYSLYNEDKEVFCMNHTPCGQADWNALCTKDYGICQAEWSSLTNK